MEKRVKGHHTRRWVKGHHTHLLEVEVFIKDAGYLSHDSGPGHTCSINENHAIYLHIAYCVQIFLDSSTVTTWLD